MPRVTSNVARLKRKNKVMKLAKGYWGGRSKLWKAAKEAVERAQKYAYRDRRRKKGDFRRLWITRINAAARHREIDRPAGARGMGELTLARCERLFQLPLEGVRGPADRFAVGRLEPGKRTEDFGEGAGLASQDLRLEILENAFVSLRNCAETLPQRVDGCQEVAHTQRAFFATSASCRNASASRTARSARTLRLIATPARLSPLIRRL